MNVTLPIDDTISKEWVKSLESTNDNSAIVDTDGEGNYKLTVFSDAGGDVRTDTSNTYNEDTTQTMGNLVSTTAVVDEVDLTAKNVAQDISIESAATAAANAETAASAATSAASTAQATADNNALNILPKAETYYLNNTNDPSVVAHSCSNGATSYTIEIFFNIIDDIGEDSDKYIKVSTNGSEIRNLFIYNTSSPTEGATFPNSFVRSAGTDFFLYNEDDAGNKISSYTITLDKSSSQDIISVIYSAGVPSRLQSRELFTRFTPIA